MLRDEPFIYYPRSAGARAFEKPLTLFEEYGFRPQIAQEASHWLTILSLIGAGLGVSVAPACVARVASPEVVCLPLRGQRSSAPSNWPGSAETRGPSSDDSHRSPQARTAAEKLSTHVSLKRLIHRLDQPIHR